MAADEKNTMGDRDRQVEGQPAVVWDDADMRSSYANVPNVTGGREEIVLLFGMSQAWHAGQKEIKVKLSDRIVLSPFAAKRLFLLLGRVLQDFEKRYGTLELGAAGAPSPQSVQ